MSKEDFLNILEETLSCELPENETSSNMAYYRDYIYQEMRYKSEQDVIAQLGDPRLIARTIIETYQRNHNNVYETYQEDKYEEAPQSGNNKIHSFVVTNKMVGIIALVILILVIILISWLSAMFIKIFIKYVLPILITVGLVTWVVNKIKRLK